MENALRMPFRAVMKKDLRIPMRVVLYQEGEEWIAHSLEFDLAGDGKTQEDALHNLLAAIVVQISASLKFDSPAANLFTPADARFFAMFAAGKDVATGVMRVGDTTVDSVKIEEVEARVYSDSDLAMV